MCTLSTETTQQPEREVSRRSGGNTDADPFGSSTSFCVARIMTTSSPVTEPTPGHATVSSRKETDQQHIEQVEDDTKLQKSRADLSVAETMSPTAQQPSIDNAVHFARSEGGTKERNIRKAMKQPSLCQEDVANHSHHMSRRELTPAQSNQLAAVRDLWRGTTLVMNGGAFTGECKSCALAPAIVSEISNVIVGALRLYEKRENRSGRIALWINSS